MHASSPTNQAHMHDYYQFSCLVKLILIIKLFSLLYMLVKQAIQYQLIINYMEHRSIYKRNATEFFEQLPVVESKKDDIVSYQSIVIGRQGGQPGFSPIDPTSQNSINMNGNGLQGSEQAVNSPIGWQQNQGGTPSPALSSKAVMNKNALISKQQSQPALIVQVQPASTVVPFGHIRRENNGNFQQANNSIEVARSGQRLLRIIKDPQSIEWFFLQLRPTCFVEGWPEVIIVFSVRQDNSYYQLPPFKKNRGLRQNQESLFLQVPLIMKTTRIMIVYLNKGRILSFWLFLQLPNEQSNDSFRNYIYKQIILHRLFDQKRERQEQQHPQLPRYSSQGNLFNRGP